jgi:hypothetical protein
VEGSARRSSEEERGGSDVEVGGNAHFEEGDSCSDSEVGRGQIAAGHGWRDEMESEEEEGEKERQAEKEKQWIRSSC